MSRVSVENYEELVRRSTLVKESDLKRIVAEAVQETGNRNPPAEVLSQKLIAAGLLTQWQNDKLMQGKHQGFFLGKYKLLDRIGAGGMGTVFKAEHMNMGRTVALKLISAELMNKPDSVARFRREVHMAAALHHPNIVTAYDADQVGRHHFLVMEYVEGSSLFDWLKQHGRLPIDWACECIRQAALGLQHAHEKGLIHRDIKPSNLLLDRNGIVKISDLGLVMLDAPDAESRITREGLTVGTPDFVAPEQARNPRSADIRADIYALGCTFYFLLTAEVPYPGGTPTEKMLRHSRESVPAPSRPDVR